MGRRGPPKKPSALEDLQGRPGHRPVNTEEPKPAAVASVAPPAWLAAEGRAIWEHLAPELHRLGLLTVIDVDALAGACRWWAIYRKADKALRRGLIVKTPSNGRQPAPELAIARTAFDKAMDVFTKFGITPSERARVHAPQPKGVGDAGSGEAAGPKDPHDELARRRADRAARRGTAG